MAHWLLRVGFGRDHRVAHEEAVQEHGGGGERDLRDSEHDAHLGDEVHAFAAIFALLAGGEASEDGGGAEKFFFGKDPLRLGGAKLLIG